MQPQQTQINPIAPRANSKCVTLNGHHYLIGGMTADQITSTIYEFIIKEIDNTLKLQWKQLEFKKNLFTNTNSFAACGVPAFGDRGNSIYIWGGLESSEHEQKCRNQLIQIDIDRRQMKRLKLKEEINIHSSVLFFQNNEKGGRLLAYGGTDESSTLQCFLYTLDLSESNQGAYEWKKIRLTSKSHRGFVWQHSAHFTKKSLFDGAEGRYLTVVGGCQFPHSPYPSIVEFDLNQYKQRNNITMKYGLVSHDSIVTNSEKPELLIFGGSNGGDFNKMIIKLAEGQITYKQAHPAVGCAVAESEKAFVVVGGVSGPMQINGVVIYRKQE